MNEQILEKFTNFSIEIITKIINCTIILFICTIIYKILKYSINRFFNRTQNFKKFDTGKIITLSSISKSLCKYIIYFIAVFTILINLGVNPTTLITIFGAGSVAIGLGAQNLIQDIIGGFFILFEDQFNVGDLITIQNKTGTVEDITLRTTKLRSYDGTVYIIPNGSIGVITNMCKEFINAIVDIGVDYKEDIEQVLKVLNDEMKNTSDIKGLRNVPTVLGVTELADSSVIIRIIAECDIKENYSIERILRLRIKNRFDKENISIPYPQTTVHIVKEE